MAHHELATPITEQQARALRVNDTVTLQKTLFGLRDATLIHHVRSRPHDTLRYARACGDPYRAERQTSTALVRSSAGYAPLCVGTTTSARMERFTRDLMVVYGVRLIIGKGGMGDKSLAAFSASWAALISRSSAVQPHSKRRGSSASTTSIWTI